MDSLAASGTLLLNNSHCVVKGNFYKPETVLDTISRSQAVEDGVLEIAGRDVSGRLGVSKNRKITGGVVDKTGETGVAAVCRLLLLPYATFSFRHAIPQDKLHLEQELNLMFSDVTQFLSGPSSIGLATPRDHAMKNLHALTVSVGQDFNWETTTLRNTEWEATSLRSSFDSTETPVPYASERRLLVDSTVCKKEISELLESVDRKRTETMEIMAIQAQKAQNDAAILNPGPLPSRKEKNKISPVLIGVGILVVFGVLGVAVMMSNGQSPHAYVAQTVENLDTPVAFAQPERGSQTPVPVQEEEVNPSGKAPFQLPNSGSPPNPPAVSAQSTDNSEEDDALLAPTPVPEASVTTAPASQLGTAEVSKWSAAVRANPGDAEARRQLAQAYLLAGDRNNSIQQFYEMMKLRRVDADEVIAFADNITVFVGADAAKQFLSDVLRSDPGKSAIRARLAEMR